MDQYRQVAALLPPCLRRRAEALPVPAARRVEEIRLRAGRSPTVVVGGEELPLPGEGTVTVRDLELVIEIATQASAHAALEQVRQGYFTVRGGHRIGLCGSVWSQEGQVRNLRCLSSLDLRVAHAVPGCGAELLPQLMGKSGFASTLLLGPPGGGMGPRGGGRRDEWGRRRGNRGSRHFHCWLYGGRRRGGDLHRRPAAGRQPNEQGGCQPYGSFFHVYAPPSGGRSSLLTLFYPTRGKHTTTKL